MQNNNLYSPVDYSDPSNTNNHQYFQIEPQFRQVLLPEVDPTEFVNSSRKVLLLLQDAQLLSQNLLKTEFAKQIMDAGQKSQTELIHQFIRTIPLKSDIQVSYTPYGIDFTLKPIEEGSATATVTLHLTWQRHI